ncbi:MAG: hypothetical protein QXL15_03215 [Candidatus Korarchaeota archaeon]
MMDALMMLLEGATQHSLLFSSLVFMWGSKKTSDEARVIYRTFAVVLFMLFITRVLTTITLEFSWLIGFLDQRTFLRLYGSIEIWALAYAFLTLERKIVVYTRGMLTFCTIIVGVVYGFVVDIGIGDIWANLVVAYLIGINLVIPMQYFYLALKFPGFIRRDSVKMGIGMLLVAFGVLFQYRNVFLYSPQLLYSLVASGTMYLVWFFSIVGNMLIIYAVVLKVEQ